MLNIALLAMNEFHLILGNMTGPTLSSASRICLFLSITESESVNISVITVQTSYSQAMSCYVGNCTTLENCRRETLISECSSRDYDACITTIVQKGTVREREREREKDTP